MLAAMLRKFLQKYLPSHEAIRTIGPRALRHALPSPQLVARQRRSVAGGVAAGMFAGSCRAATRCSRRRGAARRSVPRQSARPVAVTLYTNPITIGPLYVIAYWIGTLLVPGDSAAFTHPPGSTGRTLARLAARVIRMGALARQTPWPWAWWSWRRARDRRLCNRASRLARARGPRLASARARRAKANRGSGRFTVRSVN